MAITQREVHSWCLCDHPSLRATTIPTQGLYINQSINQCQIPSLRATTIPTQGLYINQSINQSMSDSITQGYNHSNSGSLYQSINQSMSDSITQGYNHSNSDINQSINVRFHHSGLQPFQLRASISINESMTQ